MSAPISSGTTAIATSSDAAVTLLANANSQRLRTFNIVNEGTVKGFVSIDGGTTWIYMPAGTADAPASRTIELAEPITGVVQAKRVASGSNMTGLYADAW